MKCAHTMLLLLAALLLASSGCESGMNTPTPVRGQVHFQGRPLPGGAIVFAPDPDRGREGEVVVGTILSNGTYAMQENGAAVLKPGWYRVSIAPLGGVTAWPDKYRDPARSGLECEVIAGQENVFNFNLQ
jgi:hypothetical protein